jgi:uncharacterized protein YjiK
MRQTIFLIAGLAIFSSCSSGTSPEKTSDTFPTGYSLENHSKISLPSTLNEISGIAWNPDFMWAIDDEYGDLFQLKLETGEISGRIKFGKEEDYEDLVVLGDTAWVLRSNGDLYRVTNFLGNEPKTQHFESNLKGKNDFETLIKKPGTEDLWIMCKNCEEDKKGEASIFQFDIQAGTFQKNPIATLKLDGGFGQNSGFANESLPMEPSAAAFHPISGDLFIVSSVGKWLLVTSSTFQPKSIHTLDQKLFVQPEGLSFDPAGNLYISNEGKNQKPNLLIFPFTPR